MKRILLSLLLIFTLVTNGYCADISDWIKGDGTDAVEGGDSVSDLDSNITNYLQDPLDKLLSHHIWGCNITVTSDTVLTISVGEVTCSNSAGTIRRMRKNTSTTTVTNTSSGVGGLDTGSLAASTWYYIYAVADADATTFTAIMSASASFPTNASALYCRLIGVALTDGDSDWLVHYETGKGSEVIGMWSVPINETTTVNAGSWLALDCRSSIPSISTMGVFGLYSYDTSATSAGIWVRPTGSTWNTGTANGIYTNSSSTTDTEIGGQRWCATNSLQSIDYYNLTGDDGTSIDVEGFVYQR